MEGNLNQVLDLPSGSGQRTLDYAGFWIRFVAAFIDGILLQAVQFLIIFLTGSSFGTFNLFLFVFSLLMGIAYNALMESSEKQATLGKMAVGIKVGDETGARISLGNAIGRYLGKILSGLTLLIGYIMAGFDSKKQALHDKLANTYVFYEK